MALEKNAIQSKWEYSIPLFATVSLLISCAVVSNKKFFWNDELLSFYLLSDPSFTNMMSAWGDTFNQAPPLYFMFGWLWTKIFGNTELSLRLFSSLTLCLAFTLIWIVLRRTYNFWAVSIAVLSVFCLSELILYHNAEVRMYGLFTATCALGLLQFDSFNRKRKYSRKSLFINALIHGAIVLTHLFGILYSGAILFAFLISDRYFKYLRLNVYISVVLGWLFLLPFIPSILNQANNDAKWFSYVSASQLFKYFIFTPKLEVLFLSLLLVSAFLYVVQLKDKRSEENFTSFNTNLLVETEFSLLILAGTFLAVPVIAWVISRIVTPMLNERYIIPTIAISWSILLAYLSSKIIPTSQSEYLSRSKKSFFNKRYFILLIFVFILLFYPIRYAVNSEYHLPKSFLEKPGGDDDKYGYATLPIAVELGHDFLPRFYYSLGRRKYFHILDWETALSNTNSAYATGDYTHLSALKRHYPFINTTQSQEFLHNYKRFLVLNEPEKDRNWFEVRIQNNPEYKVRLLGQVNGAWQPLGLFLVEGKG
ncbi:MAG: glycosyltransferase family 39 protein [Chroococcidiopsidaceae cyanobacterium CP_BM_RX_35]|nr:glycosyltransferase family 39 protein [Chroococcidiopsidaceae cyanobacterium CP_BM_RX_35]